MEERTSNIQWESLFTKDLRAKRHSLGKTPKAVEASKVHSHVSDWEQAGEIQRDSCIFYFI